jgi:uncharacterized membrane protein YfcA
VALTGDLLLAGAGAVAASVNAAAGGGTLLSFPALLAAGLTPLAANATSTVGLLPGSFSSVFGLRQELHAQRRDVALVALASTAGGVLGAILLLALGSKVFALAVPALLLIASGLLLLQPLLARFLAGRGPARARGRGAMFAAMLVVAVYAGYFGAGAGILFLGAMGLLLPRDLQQVNALKVLCALLSNAVGALTFVVAELWLHPHALVLRAALPLAVGSLLGGYFGVRLVRRLPPQALRAFASAVGLAIAGWLIARG